MVSDRRCSRSYCCRYSSRYVPSTGFEDSVGAFEPSRPAAGPSHINLLIVIRCMNCPSRLWQNSYPSLKPHLPDRSNPLTALSGSTGGGRFDSPVLIGEDSRKACEKPNPHYGDARSRRYHGYSAWILTYVKCAKAALYGAVPMTRYLGGQVHD